MGRRSHGVGKSGRTPSAVCRARSDQDRERRASSIVVAVDGSEHAQRAVHWAAKQADLEHRPLVAVTAHGLEEVRAIAWAGIEGAHSYTARQLHNGARIAPGRPLTSPSLCTRTSPRRPLRCCTATRGGSFSTWRSSPTSWCWAHADAAPFAASHGLVDVVLSPRGKSWDLIVVGRHHTSALDRALVGSISTSVVERAHSNVAAVPEAAPVS